MPNERLLAYSQWYYNGRERGMGHSHASERALAILSIPKRDADALIFGLVCASEPTEFIEIVCAGDPAPAFKIDGDYYCSACGSSTYAHRVLLDDLIDRPVPEAVEANGGGEWVRAARLPLLPPPGPPHPEPAEPT
jgi:hypothetical protein